MKVLVWDLPTRIFHWGLALSFTICYFTADSDEWLDIHVFFGYLALALILFRILWSLIGSRYARITSFLYSPKAAIQYLVDLVSGHPQRYIGHNPIGSYAIYLLILLGILASLTGLLVLGAEEKHGLLANIATFEIGEQAKELHELFANTMLAIVLMHIAGVAFESWKHQENLARAILDGKKVGEASSTSVAQHKLIGGLLVLGAVIFGVSYFSGYWFATKKAPYQVFVGVKLPDDPVWREECGACHLAFHPSLLPARSWHALMEKSAEHFGEDLAFEPDVSKSIEKFLIANASERHATEPAYKIDTSLAPNETPLKITDTPYWKEQHQEIEAAVWSQAAVGAKSNCEACHLDASQGTFEDAAMRLPDGDNTKK